MLWSTTSVSILQRRNLMRKQVMQYHLAPKEQNLKMSPIIFLPQIFDCLNTIRYWLQMTKVKIWQLLFLEICFIFTLSFPPKQHTKSPMTSSAAQPPTNAILVLVLFCLALLSPLTYCFLHLMLAYRALRDIFFPFFSECSVLSVSTFLRSTDLLCTILYKGRSGSLVSQTASISIFSPSAYLKVWFGSKEMMHLLSVVPIYFILL